MGISPIQLLLAFFVIIISTKTNPIDDVKGKAIWMICPIFLYPASQINHNVHNYTYLKGKSGEDQPIVRLFFHGFHRVY